MTMKRINQKAKAIAKANVEAIETNVETNVEANAATLPEMATIANIARFIKVDEKVARGRLRTGGMREDSRVYDKSVGMWRAIPTHGELFDTVVSVMRGKRYQALNG